jgi:integrase
MFGSLKIKGATAHICRHTFINRLSMAGMDRTRIMKYARIRDIKILEIYEHLRPDFQVKYIDMLDY